MIVRVEDNYLDENRHVAITNGCSCCQMTYDMDTEKELVLIHAAGNLKVLFEILDYYHIELKDFIRNGGK